LILADLSKNGKEVCSKKCLSDMEKLVHRPTIIASVLAVLVFASWLYFKDTGLLIGMIASIATIYLGYVRLRIEHDTMFKSLFESFNARYDHKMNNLINSLAKSPEHKLSTDERNIILDYFNLCAEEYMWYKKGRLPKEVWSSWKAGMEFNLEVPQIRSLYIEQKEESTSYYGLMEELTLNP